MREFFIYFFPQVRWFLLCRKKQVHSAYNHTHGFKIQYIERDKLCLSYCFLTWYFNHKSNCPLYFLPLQLEMIKHLHQTSSAVSTIKMKTDTVKSTHSSQLVSDLLPWFSMRCQVDSLLLKWSNMRSMMGLRPAMTERVENYSTLWFDLNILVSIFLYIYIYIARLKILFIYEFLKRYSINCWREEKRGQENRGR